MNLLRTSQVTFFSGSGFDAAGRVFFHEGRVFRTVFTKEAANACRRILDSAWFGDAIDAGLVNTWIPRDVALEGAELVLEHERIPFPLHPAESTSYMHWLSAKTVVRLAALLSRHGETLADAHPWNVAFHRGRPRFIDFGSLVSCETPFSAWLEEFRRYYAAPIWLASKSTALAREYRREHINGFGSAVFDLRLLRATLLRPVTKLHRSVDRSAALDELERWLDAHKPGPAEKQRWAEYQQGSDGDPRQPTTPKQRFVHDALASASPSTVIDCAANKGFYSEMASRLGASVAALDYEEYCVDACLASAESKGLDITPALMDFRQPTPPHGLGLTYGSAYERLKSQIALVLGLCHHLCIAQRLPVKLFCDICMEYSTDGVILEYVDPADLHVAAWRLPSPPDYSFDTFASYFARKYPRRRAECELSQDGLARRLVFFSR